MEVEDDEREETEEKERVVKMAAVTPLCHGKWKKYERKKKLLGDVVNNVHVSCLCDVVGRTETQAEERGGRSDGGDAGCFGHRERSSC